MSKACWFSLIAAGALLTGCRTPRATENRSSQEAGLPEYVYYADTVLLRWVSKVIHQHGLTELPSSALVFLCGTSADGTYREVEVREKKGFASNLDPHAGRRLFAVRIDLQDGALVTDASRFDGKAYPGEPRYRLLLPGVMHPRR